MTHLFRPADPSHVPYSPSWKAWRGLLYVMLNRWLAPAVRLWRAGALRACAGPLLLLAGLLCQLVMLLVAGYLIDLCINLMELWAELARKHLELTL